VVEHPDRAGDTGQVVEPSECAELAADEAAAEEGAEQRMAVADVLEDDAAAGDLEESDARIAAARPADLADDVAVEVGARQLIEHGDRIKGKGEMGKGRRGELERGVSVGDGV
jgi:hypothetical protein